MNEHTQNVLVSFFVLVYNFMLVAGTAYLVALYNWSPWWFLLTFGCMLTLRTNKDKKE